MKNKGINTKLKEQFSLKISSNENTDKILLQLYKIDTQPTLKNLDLSMRFYRNMRQQRGRSDDKIPKGLEYYDDEQKLILLGMHYNFNLMKALP